MKSATGFGYISFLILISILAVLILGFNIITLRQHAMQALDFSRLQAKAYAETGYAYYQTNPTLNANHVSITTIQSLISLEGITFPLTSGGFKIAENKGTIYSLGYTGTSLQKATSTQVLKITKEQISPWYEN